jgi:hypothetical protein
VFGLLLHMPVHSYTRADGWINRVRDCLFAGNHIGLHVWNQANNIDVTGSNFYGNKIAILAEEAGQIKISGNCMEGGQGPAIIASSIYGLTVSCLLLPYVPYSQRAYIVLLTLACLLTQSCPCR